MRLGGPIFGTWDDPTAWAALVRDHGYRAAYCPLTEIDDALVAAYARAANDADLTIAEVGAWSNPISPDQEAARSATALCQERLALADAIGARCCVNIAGSRGEKWYWPHPDNLTDDTFALVVDSVRAIIDAVHPTRTRYALEAMPWAFPDSPDTYLQLIEAIDRPAFAVHLDPVNFVNSPRRFYGNGVLLRECFAKLGPYVVSCHAKDISLREGPLSVQFDEVRPGAGRMDYRTFLRGLSALDADMPLMLEHLPSAEEYAAGAAYIRSLAQEEVIA